MKILFTIFLSFNFISSNFSTACTTFCIHTDNDLVFGRNYDFMIGNGIVFVNKAGVIKNAFTSQQPAAHWVSKYGSVTFNQFGREFPTGGINQTGLVVELMWLDDTRYPEADNRPATGGVLQWIQYQLDNCETIQEVIDTDKDIRIPQKAVPIHFLISDKYGNSATLEFLDGKLKVHKSDEMKFEVLTNDTYDKSIEYYNSQLNKLPAGTDYERNSLNRFAKTCSMIKEYQNKSDKNTVDYAFKILNDVDQGEHTKWSIVYDIKNMKIYFKTFEYQNIKNIEITSLDFNCSAPSKMIDINNDYIGNINSKFIDYSYNTNRKLIEDSYNGVDFLKNVSSEDKDLTAKYPEELTCRSKSSIENDKADSQKNFPYEGLYIFTGVILVMGVFTAYKIKNVKRNK